MSPSCLAAGPCQLAYAVSDVRAAAASWEQRGAGPFVVSEHIAVSEVSIEGRPGVFDHSSAYGWWGGIMIELVEVHEPTELGGVGLHHQAFMVPSFADAVTELTDRGWPLVMSARAGSTRFAFLDARAELGHLVEVYERSEGLETFYARVAAAAGAETAGAR